MPQARGLFDFYIALACGRADISPQLPAGKAGCKLKIDETSFHTPTCNRVG